MHGPSPNSAASFAQARSALDQFLRDDTGPRGVDAIAATLVRCYHADGKVMICGNGGSLCDAIHFAEELTGRFRRDRRALAALALADPGHLTCVGNDYGFEHVFSRAVEALGRAGDVLIVLSTSGNSANIVRAVEAARSRNVQTVALLGKGGGKLRGTCDLEVVVPGEAADRIQELHMLILHTLVELVERGLGLA